MSLKLDHNPIGSRGMVSLSAGLMLNSSIRVLSLQYCGITSDSATLVSNILMSTSSIVETLDLEGNPLGDVGVCEILSVGVRRSKSLHALNLASTQIQGTKEWMSTIIDTIRDCSGVAK